jgi:hypothetical protein
VGGEAPDDVIGQPVEGLPGMKFAGKFEGGFAVVKGRDRWI